MLRAQLVWSRLTVAASPAPPPVCTSGPRPILVCQRGYSTCWAATITSALAAFKLGYSLGDPDGPEADLAKQFWRSDCPEAQQHQKDPQASWDHRVVDIPCALKVFGLAGAFIQAPTYTSIKASIDAGSLVLWIEAGDIHTILIWAACQTLPGSKFWFYGMDPQSMSDGIFHKVAVEGVVRALTIRKLP